MSTYRGYCQGQAIECARRTRMASTPAVAEHYRELGKHWLKLAEKERAKARLKGTTVRMVGAEAVQVSPSTSRTPWRGLLELAHRRLAA